MPAERVSVLIADDEPHIHESLRRSLFKLPFDIIDTFTIEETLAVLQTRHVYLVFVDLYLDGIDKTTFGIEKPFGIEVLKNFPHLPCILMSGQNNQRVEKALKAYDDHRLRIVNKDDDLSVRESVLKVVNDHTKNYYTEATFDFKKSHQWSSIADKLNKSASDLEKRDLTHELEHLAKKAFCNWDTKETLPNVRAQKIWVMDVLDSGSNSIVLWMRPESATEEHQADVIFKVSPITHSDEHSRFNEFKNIVGGYGLRERRYRQTVHLQGQVYAVPYYDYEDTTTYAQYFKNLNSDTKADLDTLKSLTKYLFDRTLARIHKREPNDDMRNLAAYYQDRINPDKNNPTKRYQAIKTLKSVSAPLQYRKVAKNNRFTLNDELQFDDPTEPVLGNAEGRMYKGMNQMVETALRHGDMHAGNVLVNNVLLNEDEKARLSCWFIDYEAFNPEHYILVDHTEFEATVWFNLMPLEENPQLGLKLLDTLTPLPNLNKLDHKALDAIQKSTTERNEQIALAKVISVISVVRKSASKMTQGMDDSHYYHALMYEALRVAGKSDADKRKRWFALLAAGLLFDKVQKHAK